MGDSSTLDMLKRLIVGKRGRGRADRLLVTGADGVTRPIEIKPQKNVSTYVDLVEACAPVRIEAYAAGELVDAFGEIPQAPAAAPPKKPKAKNGKPADPLDAEAARWREVKDLTQHMNTLLANAYKTNSQDDKEREAGLWETFRAIAQHQADRANAAEARVEILEKAVRIRDRAIIDRDRMLQQMQQKFHEYAAQEGGDDKRSTMFMKLLDIAAENKAATTTPPPVPPVEPSPNGAASKKGAKPS